MSGGGASGQIQFPQQVSDWHGILLAGREVDISTGKWAETYDQPYTQYSSTGPPNIFRYSDVGSNTEWWDYPKNNVTRVLNWMMTSSPSASLVSYAGNPYYVGATSTPFAFTNPSTHLAAIETFFDLAHAQTTSYVDSTYSDFVTAALLAVTGVPTSTIADIALGKTFTSAASAAYANIGKISQIFQAHSAAIRGEMDDYTDQIHAEIGGNLPSVMSSAATTALHALAMTGFTTLWEAVVDQANTKLSTCGIPKNVNTLAILTKAAQDTDANLKASVRLAKTVINGDLLADITEKFGTRRETYYQQQIGEFAGTMADLNAVNSTGFLWGVALLRSEQMREVAEFDSQLSLQAYDKAIDSYITMRATDLQVGLQAELANAGAHNALLQASIQLLALLKQREELTPAQVLSVWGPMFNAEVAAYTQLVTTAFRDVSSVEALSLDSEKLEHAAEQVNKTAREERYARGLGEVGQYLKNKVVLMDTLASIREKQKTVRIMAEREYEGHELDKDIRASYWDMEAMRFASDILVAPAGMAGMIPKQPSVAQQAIGYTLQAASVASGFIGGGG